MALSKIGLQCQENESKLTSKRRESLPLFG